jgi:hypothetical protein
MMAGSLSAAEMIAFSAYIYQISKIVICNWL